MFNIPNENLGIYYKVVQNYFEDISLTRNHSSKGQGGYEFIVKCPFCGKDKLYINSITGRNKCWSVNCEYHGKGGNLPHLIAEMRSISYGQAKEEVDALTNIEDISASLSVNIEGLIRSSFEELSESTFDVMPDDAVRASVRDPKLLDWLRNGRSPSWGSKGAEWFLGTFPIYLLDRSPFRNRALFEITSWDNRAYLAYTMVGADIKTLNPKNDVLSRMLFHYNECHKEELLFVCEGIFSAARVIASGYDAVCTFGVSLSPYQGILLSKSNAKNIVFLYDSGAKEKAYQNAMFMANNFGGEKNYFYHEIELDGKDPDDLGFKGCRQYLSEKISNKSFAAIRKGYSIPKINLENL